MPMSRTILCLTELERDDSPAGPFDELTPEEFEGLCDRLFSDEAVAEDTWDEMNADVDKLPPPWPPQDEEWMPASPDAARRGSRTTDILHSRQTAAAVAPARQRAAYKQSSETTSWNLYTIWKLMLSMSTWCHRWESSFIMRMIERRSTRYT